MDSIILHVMRNHFSNLALCGAITAVELVSLTTVAAENLVPNGDFSADRVGISASVGSPDELTDHSRDAFTAWNIYFSSGPGSGVISGEIVDDAVDGDGAAFRLAVKTEGESGDNGLSDNRADLRFPVEGGMDYELALAAKRVEGEFSIRVTVQEFADVEAAPTKVSHYTLAPGEDFTRLKASLRTQDSTGFASITIRLRGEQDEERFPGPEGVAIIDAVSLEKAK